MNTISEAEAVSAMSARRRPPHPVSSDCWRILDALRQGDPIWTATAVRLNGLGMLSYRGRISDLRIKHGLEIVADSQHDAATGKVHTTYRVPSHAWARAMHLWRFRTLDEYSAAARQCRLF